VGTSPGESIGSRKRQGGTAGVDLSLFLLRGGEACFETLGSPSGEPILEESNIDRSSRLRTLVAARWGRTSIKDQSRGHLQRRRDKLKEGTTWYGYDFCKDSTGGGGMQKNWGEGNLKMKGKDFVRLFHTTEKLFV